MVRASGGDRSSVTPDDRQPQTTPREATNSGDFMLAAMMDLKASFARVETKIETLEKCVEKLEGGVGKLEHTLSQVKGGLIVAGVVFTILLAIITAIVGGDLRVSRGPDAPKVPVAAVQPVASTAPAQVAAPAVPR